MVLGHELQMDDWLGLLAGAGTTLLLRATALWTGWRLPAWNTGESGKD